ncbi:MAG: MBL fold metallo-hydrolase [Deltaproteobacteria bacterium]|jgi:glyoxylase-like metal-dependent hydrolase (beta-lactamase superfamily II)|nr:MBL fold metallo-hydrolase [Deltaproteobacteria bacterium]
MRIYTFPLGPLETNCYLLVEGNEAAAVDPGGSPDAVTRYLDANNLKLTAILNTHLHFDHVLGNAELSAATGAPVYANSLDGYLLRPEMSASRYGLPDTPPFAYVNQEEGATTLIGLSCRILHTPGHTPGSLSFYFSSAGALFCGDLLFHRSVGRTDLPGGDTDALRDSIRRKVFTLPPDTVVYPGHGPATSVGDEQRMNPFVGGL